MNKTQLLSTVDAGNGGREGLSLGLNLKCFNRKTITFADFYWKEKNGCFHMTLKKNVIFLSSFCLKLNLFLRYVVLNILHV